MSLDQPTIYKNFISEDERLELLDVANKVPLHINWWRPFGKRRSADILNTQYETDIVCQLTRRIAVTIGLNSNDAARLNTIISVIEPGAGIQPHNDPLANGKTNFRFNVMVDRDTDISYNPIIDKVSYDVGICDAWCFNASRLVHRMKVIKGSVNRVVYQFGFMV